MELVLIRHAEPVRVDEGPARADPGLTERGVRQAAAAAGALAADDVSPTAVWTSPLRRSVETAEHIAAALGVALRIDDDLAEYDRDATSYIPIEDLKGSDDPRWQAMAAGRLEDLPGVDPNAFRTRVVGACEQVVDATPGGVAVVVAHGGVLNAYVGHVLGIDRPLWFEPAYASISRVRASRSGVRSVWTLNEHAHLRGLLR